MKRLLRRRSCNANDGGFAMIAALLFVLVVGLIMGALLPYAGTGLQESVTARDVRDIQHDLDGAVEAAIGNIRSDAFAGFPGHDCPTFVSPPGADGRRVEVQCQTAGGFIYPTDRPLFAVQTLDGPLVVTGNNKTLTIAGPVAINGGPTDTGDVTLDGPNQRLAGYGPIYATGSCDAAVAVVGGEPECDLDPADMPPNSGDPGFSPALSDVPMVVDPPGVCDVDNPRSVVRFEPGYYSETPRPDPATCTGPNHTTWWFSPWQVGAVPPAGDSSPGVYYFDFPDETFANYTAAHASFSLGDAAIVAGTPVGWDPLTSDSDDVRDLMPGACDAGSTDEDDATPPASGVQLVFGGPTQLSIAAQNKIEVCASAQTDGQMIAMHGLGAGDERMPETARVLATNGQSSSTNPFLTPTNAEEIGESPTPAVSAAELVGTGSLNTATVVLESFTSTPLIPAGSLITRAILRVAHFEQKKSVQPRVELTLTSGTRVFDEASTPKLLNRQSLGVDELDITTLLTEPYRYKDLDLSNIGIRYTADGSQLKKNPVPETSLATLDGIELEVEFVAPALERVRCVNTCWMFQNTVANDVFFKGTVYAPLATLHVTVHNQRATIFNRGVIAASLIANVGASSKQEESPFSVPGEAFKRRVLFSARLVNDDGSFERVQLRALVEFTDHSGTGSSALPFAGKRVKVARWTVLR